MFYRPIEGSASRTGPNQKRGVNALGFLLACERTIRLRVGKING